MVWDYAILFHFLYIIFRNMISTFFDLIIDSNITLVISIHIAI